MYKDISHGLQAFKVRTKDTGGVSPLHDQSLLLSLPQVFEVGAEMNPQ
jgi:hypothetical protein